MAFVQLRIEYQALGCYICMALDCDSNTWPPKVNWMSLWIFPSPITYPDFVGYGIPHIALVCAVDIPDVHLSPWAFVGPWK